MLKEEIDQLVARYFDAEGYEFSTQFEHRVDPRTSAIMYSLLREYKPRVALSFGTWYGGSACLIMSALQKNKKPFTYVTAEILEGMRDITLKNVFDKCGQTPVMLGDVTKSLDKIPKKIDFLFHDTDHDLKTTKWVVENIFPRIKTGSLVVWHDWAVKEINGEWVGKGTEGAGGLPETQYLMDLHKQGELPLQKLYWMWEDTSLEGAFWIKI